MISKRLQRSKGHKREYLRSLSQILHFKNNHFHLREEYTLVNVLIVLEKCFLIVFWEPLVNYEISLENHNNHCLKHKLKYNRIKWKYLITSHIVRFYCFIFIICILYTYKYIYNGSQWNLYLTKVQIKWIGDCHILWKLSYSPKLDIIYTWSRMLWLEVETTVLPMKMINSPKLRTFEKNKTSGWIEKTLEKFTSRVTEIIWGHGTLTMMK